MKMATKMALVKIASVFLFTASVFCEDGVLDIEFPSLSVNAPDKGDIILQSGYGVEDVYITPGPGGAVILDQENIVDIIKIAKSLPPVWSKHAHMGFFGTFTGEQRINIKLDAEDPEGTRLHFVIVSGDLPRGVTLNNVTGYLTGIAPDADDVFRFTIRAIDEHGKYADAIFKMETVAKDRCLTNPCLHGGTCIDTEGWFNCSCPDRYGGPRCEFTCASQSLGVSDKRKVPDAQMSGYLTYGSNLESDGRYGVSGYGWLGSNSNSWLQVDLGNLTRIYAVRNQGYSYRTLTYTGLFHTGVYRYTSDYYTTAYTLSISKDGTTFLPVNNTNGGIHTFSSSYGDNQYSLPEPVDARFVRFHPTSYYSKPQLKVELYGCHYQ